MTQRMVNGFEYIGFEPTEFLTDHSRTKLNRVSGESPSDSSTRAILRKTVAGFEGKLQISSTVGTFVADVIDHDPIRVINALSRKVRSQLRLWKRYRFLLQQEAP